MHERIHQKSVTSERTNQISNLGKYVWSQNYPTHYPFVNLVNGMFCQLVLPFECILTAFVGVHPVELNTNIVIDGRMNRKMPNNWKFFFHYYDWTGYEDSHCRRLACLSQSWPKTCCRGPPLSSPHSGILGGSDGQAQLRLYTFFMFSCILVLCWVQWCNTVVPYLPTCLPQATYPPKVSFS